jgi:hypothetical protein
METIKVKFLNFDEENKNVVVSFSCQHKNMTFETPAYSFNITNVDITSEKNLIKHLSVIGSSYLEDVIGKYELEFNHNKISMIKNLINKEYDTPISELFPVLHTEEELKEGQDLEITL